MKKIITIALVAACIGAGAFYLHQPARAAQEPAGTLIDITTAQAFDQLINKHKRVVVMFHAPAWCSVCQSTGPHYEAFAASDWVRQNDVVVAQLDIDIEKEVPARLGIAGVPTIILFIDGQKKDQRVGGFDDPSVMQKWLKPYML